MRKLSIQIVVGGRFHVEPTVTGLMKAGHDVELITCLPRSRFKGLTQSQIKSSLVPEILMRSLTRLGFQSLGLQLKAQAFGKFAARQVQSNQKPFDVLLGWSSFSKEAFEVSRSPLKILVRSSAHILYQDNMLREEYSAFHVKYPEQTVINERELYEYEKADYILVPSQFARDTFIKQGILGNKVKSIPLGVDNSLFTPPQITKTVLPLKVMNFGFQSLRKGIPYLLEATKRFSPDQLELHLVGHTEPIIEKMLRGYPNVKLRTPVSQSELNQIMQDMHVFVLPTLEDGFGMSLIQAMAAGLAPIATVNAGASEVVQNGSNGFVVPIRRSDAIAEAFEKWIRSPELLFQMRREATKVRNLLPWARHCRDLSDWLASVASTNTKAVGSSR